jgi:hypothetical protein
MDSWALWLSARWLIALACFLGALGLSEALAAARPEGAIVLVSLGLGLALGGTLLVRGTLVPRGPGRMRPAAGGPSLPDVSSSQTRWVAARYPGVLLIATGVGVGLGASAAGASPLWPLATAGILAALAAAIESRRR